MFDPIVRVIGFEEEAAREPAPGGNVFVGAQVLRGELEDLTRSERLKSHSEHDDNLTASHMARVPVFRYGDVIF